MTGKIITAKLGDNFTHTKFQQPTKTLQREKTGKQYCYIMAFTLIYNML